MAESCVAAAACRFERGAVETWGELEGCAGGVVLNAAKTAISGVESLVIF